MCPQRPIPKHRVNELMESLKHVHDAQEYRHRRAQCVLLRITKSMMAEQVSPITGYHPHQVCQRTKREQVGQVAVRDVGTKDQMFGGVDGREVVVPVDDALRNLIGRVDLRIYCR